MYALNSTVVSLTLPNGAILRSKNLYDRGTFTRLQHSINPGHKKLQMPLLGLFSSGTDFHVAALDFDYVPTGVASFEALKELLWDVPGLVVCNSPSGRVKAFATFRWGNHHPDANRVAERLNELLPDVLKDKFDKKGISRCFLSTEVSGCLSGLGSSSYFDWSEEGTEQGNSNIVCDSYSPIISRSFSYHLADQDTLPHELQEFINPTRRGHEARLKFCRIMVASFGLTESFSLPTKTIGEQCGVDSSTVSTWLKWFRDNNLLVKLSNSYIVGLTAIKYKAIGVLRAAIIKRKQGLSYITVLPKKLPKDGQFYRFFLSLSARKLPWLQFKSLLDAVPGIEYKNRYQMAKNIWECDRRKEVNL